MRVAGFEAVTPSVFESAADPVTVDRRQIGDLLSAARMAPNGRARLLLHPDRDDSLHEMIIALPPGSCDHPHINYKSGKSFTAVAGQFAVIHFSQDGTLATPVVLSAGPWAGAVLTRLRQPAWHTIIPLAGQAAFVETIIGPFSGNRFAEWFPRPESADHPAAVERLRQIARKEAERLASS